MDLQEASNPQTPQALLETFARGGDPELKRAIAQNPNASLSTLLSLAALFPDEVSKNPALSLFLLESPSLVQSMDLSVAKALSSCEAAPLWLVALLIRYPKTEVTSLIAARPDLTEELLVQLVEARVEIDQILEHPRLTDKVLCKIAASEQLTDKLLLARAPLLSSAAKKILEKDTDPQVQLALRWRAEEASALPPPAVRWSGATDVGLERSYNEDAFGGYVGRALSLFLVADGMGGHSTGEIAARAVREAWLKEAHLAEEHPQPPGLFLHRVFVQSFEEIQRAARQVSYSISGLGCTAVALLLQGQEATIAHSGDCRAYLFREKSLSLLTNDHRLIRELLERNYPLSEEQREQFSNIITRSLGFGRSASSPDMTRLSVQPNDLFLLCSDGVTDLLKEAQIREVLAAEDLPLEERVSLLLRRANEAGGKDNSTALLVEVLP